MRPIIRRALAVVGTWVAVLGACAATALAATVDGGGSFDDAPLLAAGSHSDTVLPQETLFYAVALHAGQRMRVRAAVDLSAGSKSNTQGVPDAFGGFGLTLYSPLRERLPSPHVGAPQVGGKDLQTDGYTLLGPRVAAAATADRRAVDRGEDWTGPGIYHVTAAISQIYGDLGAVVEFPLRLEITIDGPASATGTAPPPGPLGAPPAQAPARRAAPRAPPASTGARISGAVLAAAGAAGLIGGLVLGFCLVRLVAAIRPDVGPTGPSG